MDVKIREGNENDFPTMLGLIKELAAYENMAGRVRNTVDQMIQDKDMFTSFVAEDDGKIIGFALYFFSYSTWVGKGLYLEDLYVKPEFRRKKIGSMLLRKIFEVAEKEQCKRVRWQVLDWNKDAIRFYEKHGAIIHKEWFNCDFESDAIDRFLGRK